MFILWNAERIVFFDSTREGHTVLLFNISILGSFEKQAKSETIQVYKDHTHASLYLLQIEIVFDGILQIFCQKLKHNTQNVAQIKVKECALLMLIWLSKKYMILKHLLYKVGKNLLMSKIDKWMSGCLMFVSAKTNRVFLLKAKGSVVTLTLKTTQSIYGSKKKILSVICIQ